MFPHHTQGGDITSHYATLMMHCINFVLSQWINLWLSQLLGENTVEWKSSWYLVTMVNNHGPSNPHWLQFLGGEGIGQRTIIPAPVRLMRYEVLFHPNSFEGCLTHVAMTMVVSPPLEAAPFSKNCLPMAGKCGVILASSVTTNSHCFLVTSPHVVFQLSGCLPTFLLIVFYH